MNKTKCKQCKKEFDNTPFSAWGQDITPVRCRSCREKNKQHRIYNQKYDANFGRMLEKERVAHNKLKHRGENPGGYCIDCGFGRDWS